MKLQSDGGWSLRLFHTLVWHLVGKYSNSWVLEIHLGYLSSCLPTCWPQSSRTSHVEFESSQRDCTKRDGQKLPVFSNLASMVMRHHFCVVCRGRAKPCSGSRAGDRQQVFMGRSRRIYGHVLKPPPASWWLMRSCTVIGTT